MGGTVIFKKKKFSAKKFEEVLVFSISLSFFFAYEDFSLYISLFGSSPKHLTTETGYSRAVKG